MATALRLAVVAPELLHLGPAGGIGTTNWHLLHLLAAHGWDTHVLYCGPKQPAERLAAVTRRLEASGIVFQALDDSAAPPELQLPTWGPVTADLLESERVLRALSPLAADRAFDLIVFADWRGLGCRAVQARRAGTGFRETGLLVELHGMTAWVRQGNEQWPVGETELTNDYSERFAFEHADFPVAPSQYMLNVTNSLGWRPRKPPFVLRNPWPLATAPAPEDAAEHIDEIVFFGRLELRKGLATFLDALTSLPASLKVTFLGPEGTLPDGRPGSDLIRDSVRSRELRIETRYNSDEALSYLAAGRRLAVLPSEVENYSNAIIECLINGIPCLASRAGGTPEIVTDPELQRRLLFEPRAKTLSACVSSYLAAPASERAAWTGQARQNMDIGAHNAEVAAAFRACAERARTAARRPAIAVPSPLVTVAVTHCNLGAYLPDALESLERQTYRDLEVLVIDDGSTDPESQRVFTEQEAAHPSFRFIRQPNAGLPAARNRLLAEAKGELFLPVDADDVATPDLVSRLVDALSLNPSAGAAGCFALAFETREDLAHERFMAAYRFPGGPDVLAAVNNVYCGPYAMHRTSVFRSVGGSDDSPDNTFEDWHSHARLVRAGHEFVVVPEYLYWYRVRPDSMSRNVPIHRGQLKVVGEFIGTPDTALADRVDLWTGFVGAIRGLEKWRAHAHQLQLAFAQTTTGADRERELLELRSQIARLGVELEQQERIRHDLAVQLSDMRRHLQHLHVRAADRLYELSASAPLLHRGMVAIFRPALRAWTSTRTRHNDAEPAPSATTAQPVRPVAVSPVSPVTASNRTGESRTLVAGWFSMADEGRCGATAGDLQALVLAREWLTKAGRSFDVALMSAFPGGVDWRAVAPERYDSLLLVCGPFMPDEPQFKGLLERFAHCRLLGLNLSMLHTAHAERFASLVARDDLAMARPDVTFLSEGRRWPIAGVLRVHGQPEYGDRARHTVADAAIDRLVEASGVVRLDIDTRLIPNPLGLASPEEIESLIARMDLVITTRLHGMVHALKHGVPAVVIDPIAGGAKVAAQARAVGWTPLFTADALDDGALQEAVRYCLTDDARRAAHEAGRRGRMGAAEIERRFRASISSD